MNELEFIKTEIENIKKRNKQVEANKAWETSITRKIILFVMTYSIAGLVLLSIKNPSPWTNALIPAVGFFLSTLTLPFIKDYWRKYIYKK